jgi:predicted amidohydrolase
MRVAVCQLDLAVGDLQGNRASGVQAIVAAAGSGADLVLLPELSDSGYVFSSLAEARSCASSSRENPTLDEWIDLARQYNLAIIGGFCELGEDGKLYNSAACVDPTGVRLIYRKMHLWDHESEFFSSGNQLSPICELMSVKVAVAICYDLEFPELVRLLALQGVEVLAVPTNWPATVTPADERPIELIKAQASAATNGIWIAIADRGMTERGVDWVGCSTIINPDGYPTATPLSAEQIGIVVTDIEPSRAGDKSVTPRNDLFRDRREDVYRVVVQVDAPQPNGFNCETPLESFLGER